MLCAINVMAGEIEIKSAWIRATAPGQKSGSILLSITSRKDARLVAASSPLAGSVEIHSMIINDNQMIMRTVDSVPLPAGKTVDLAKSGYHLMLLNLKNSLKEGENVPFSLTIRLANNHRIVIRSQATVVQLCTNDGMHDMGKM